MLLLYAVIQDEFKKLDPVKVCDVYAELFKISKIDAQTKIINQPYGILAFGLEEEKANDLADKLQLLSYTCHIKPISKLLALHDATQVFSAKFCDEGIIFENLFGEQKRILWNHVQMIEVYCLQGKSISLQNRKRAKRLGKPSTVTIKKEQITSGKYIEIYSDSPNPRLQIDASRFNYSGLGDQMNSDSQVNFELLLSQIKKNCEKFEVSYSDSSSLSTYSELEDFEAYSHWKLQNVEK